MPLTGSGSFPAIALPISTYLSGVAVVFNHLDGRFPEVGRSNPAFHIGLIGHYHLSSSCLLLPDLEKCWLDFLFLFNILNGKCMFLLKGMDAPTFQKLYIIYDYNLESTLKEIQVDRLMQGFRQKNLQAYHKYRNAWLRRLSYSYRSIVVSEIQGEQQRTKLITLKFNAIGI